MDWTSGQYVEFNRHVLRMVLFRRPLVAGKTFVWARLLECLETCRWNSRIAGSFGELKNAPSLHRPSNVMYFPQPPVIITAIPRSSCDAAPSAPFIIRGCSTLHPAMTCGVNEKDYFLSPIKQFPNHRPGAHEKIMLDVHYGNAAKLYSVCFRKTHLCGSSIRNRDARGSHSTFL